MIDTVEPLQWNTSIQGTQNLVPEECSCNLCICFCIKLYWREISIKEKGHFVRIPKPKVSFLSFFFIVKSTNYTILVFPRKINWLASNTRELTYLFFKEDVKSQCKSQNQKNKHNHNLEYSLRHFDIHWDVSAKQAISSEKQHHVGVAHEDCNNSNIPKYLGILGTGKKLVEDVWVCDIGDHKQGCSDIQCPVQVIRQVLEVVPTLNVDLQQFFAYVQQGESQDQKWNSSFEGVVVVVVKIWRLLL